MNLTAEQRIVLQCLASTGGEPTAMATCTGGRLAMKEFFQCVDKRMFEGNCVGRNVERIGNELAKRGKELVKKLSPKIRIRIKKKPKWPKL